MTKSRFHKLHKLFFFIAKKNLKQPSKGLSMRGINYGRELLSRKGRAKRIWQTHPDSERTTPFLKRMWWNDREPSLA